jgi:hypothetical protein
VSLIRRPEAEDLREGPAAALARAAEELAGDTKEVRSAGSRLGWMIAAGFAAPALLTAIYMPASRSAPLLATFLPIAIILAGWSLFAGPELKRRREGLRGRRERIDAMEDTSELRAQALRAEATISGGGAS